MKITGLLRSSVVVAIAATSLLVSCGSSGDSTNAPTTDGPALTSLAPSPDATTAEYKTQLSEADAVSGVAGDQDLTLTATSPIVVPGSTTGATIELVVPAGAVPAGTEITLTPITAVLAYGRSWQVLAGVQFSPDGLQFSSPGELTITMPTTVAGQFSMISEHAGEVDKFALEQGLSKLSTPVNHFSSVSIVPDALSDYDSTIAGDPGEYRVAQIKMLDEWHSITGFDEAPTQLIDAVNETLSGQFKEWWFGSEKAATIGNELVEGLVRSATLCPKDVDKMKAVMKKAISLGIEAGLDLQGWTPETVDGLFKDCDRYTVTLEGHISLNGPASFVSQTVKSTIVVTGGTPLASFGEGILFSKFEDSSGWDTTLLDQVNTIRAENGAAPCTAHSIPGTVQVASLDTTSDEGLNYVDLNLWDAIHDWGGPFGCESLDGGYATYADTLTEFGKSNSFRIALEPKKDGWAGEMEMGGSTAAGGAEFVMKIAVVRTPGAHLTEPGGRGHAVGSKYPYYDHYHWEIDNNQVIMTAWDSSDNSTVVVNISADGTDGYSDLDQGWDGEWDLPIEDPYQEPGDWDDPDYWNEDWWPIDEWPQETQDSVEMEIPIGEDTSVPDDSSPDTSDSASTDTTPSDTAVADD